MKAKLRSDMIQQLKNINLHDKRKIEKKIMTQLFQTSIWKNAKVIGTTMAQNFEWNTAEIIQRGWKEQKDIVIPKANKKSRQLTFYTITSFQDVKKGYANIMEPNIYLTEKVSKDKIDLLIVPGLIFDRYGYRIGFGGGFYDRFLADFHQTTVSLASEQQLIDKIPREEYDKPVQFIITENRCIRK